jgi:hypothetical protein
MRLLAVTLSAAACVASCGCDVSHSWEGIVALSASGEKNGVKYSYWYVDLTVDGRVYLVLAADNCTGGALSTGTSATSNLDAFDGRKIAWSCTTQNGSKGAVTIDGQRFELANGAVFLISTKENKTKVDQLAIDLSKLGRTSVGKDLLSLADTQPRIETFFKDMRENK